MRNIIKKVTRVTLQGDDFVGHEVNQIKFIDPETDIVELEIYPNPTEKQNNDLIMVMLTDFSNSKGVNPVTVEEWEMFVGMDWEVVDETREKPPVLPTELTQPN